MKGNKNAEKHGLFSKHLPDETRDLVKAIDEISPAEILWQNITIQYAAIIRAQKIMEVKNKEELVKIEKSMAEDLDGTRVEYEIQTAWDRQGRFLTSQARAMTNLTNMLVKYEDMTRADMATEEKRLRAEKLRAEIKKIKAGLEGQESTEDQLRAYFEALEEAVIDG